MIAHRAGASCGVFWMNPSETWIDIVKKKSESRVSRRNRSLSQHTLTNLYIELHAKDS